MKRFLALTCALALTFSMTVCAAGSPTVSVKRSSKPKLKDAVVAREVIVVPEVPQMDRLAENVKKTIAEYVSNTIVETPGITDAAPIAQGGGCVINGASSNATFSLDRVDFEVADYAVSKAMSVGGSVLNVVEISAPGVNFSNAEVGFRVEGIKAGDQIKVYKAVEGDWQEVEVVEISENSVTIKMDSVGIYNFVKIS
ncbi:MAG: hypothetical protein J6K48_03025 [Lachnospiraceae bacterium]|nr:hypothetical protein [Lachnospiraceae bacterium]